MLFTSEGGQWSSDSLSNSYVIGRFVCWNRLIDETSPLYMAWKESLLSPLYLVWKYSLLSPLYVVWKELLLSPLYMVWKESLFGQENRFAFTFKCNAIESR